MTAGDDAHDRQHFGLLELHLEILIENIDLLWALLSEVIVGNVFSNIVAVCMLIDFSENLVSSAQFTFNPFRSMT